MASPPLAVRNLTSSPLTLVRIETFPDPNGQHSKSDSSFFGSQNTTSVAPGSPQLEEHSQTFTSQDVAVKIHPFESYTLPACAPSHQENASAAMNSATTIRLTIQSATNDRHRIDINPAYTQKSCRPLTPLCPSPALTFSSIYHPSQPSPSTFTVSHLTIHMHHLQSPKSWMTTLPSSLPLSALSIPGTHNSHTHYRALPSVRCQIYSVKTQLENGIRFLDVRAQPVHASDPSKKDMYLVHGAFPVSLTGPKYLAPVLETCYRFLVENPGETILISLKREGTGKSTDALFSEILFRHYIKPNQAKWYTQEKIPYLSDVRGKLVLIRRYTSHSAAAEQGLAEKLGLDATAWPHNSTHALHGPFCVQDYCEVLEPSFIPHKLTYTTEHLARASCSPHFIPGFTTDEKNPVPPSPLFLNFLTGSNFWRRECWPSAIAATINRGVEEWICRGLGAHDDDRQGEGKARVEGINQAGEGDRHTGVVIMDDVGSGGDWDLVRLVIACNLGVLMKMGAV